MRAPGCFSPFFTIGFDRFPFGNVVSWNQGLACHIGAIFSQTVACIRHIETV